ncbi:MAG: hypothetical protein OEY51_13950, partial [Cyclobacteriaceae bacterium]|nr:hypothetical protein [Cyclobacteriaceae bacterium]
MRKVMIAVAVWVTGISCTPKPEEIKYGEDLCHFCSMAIVDDKFSAQYVTKKGRAYKFDAIECMIHELE